MTDNEIIKALKCCMKNDIAQCKICAYDKFGQGCRRKLNPDILDLINRQQAEIARLESGTMANAEVVKAVTKELKTAKSEAIKEFAERICEGRVSNDPVVIAVKVELERMKEVTEVEK